ncbi:hypothetical protein [Nonomuraea typhae]|uniref:hypothetical protein n=1 Tax=Nonomuraea typhae TaxID=2603600 RepID=UPI0012FB9409|nr:hypothetical protein [Nonomuraea typhae]
MTSALEPIAVFDVNDVRAQAAMSGDRPYWESVLDWIRGHGLDPNEIYRLEVYRTDRLWARVHEYDRDAAGERYSIGTEVARRAPYDVILTSLPPEPSALPGRR